jgi:hypothetical protein
MSTPIGTGTPAPGVLADGAAGPDRQVPRKPGRRGRLVAGAAVVVLVAAGAVVAAAGALVGLAAGGVVGAAAGAVVGGGVAADWHAAATPSAAADKKL